MKGVDFITAYSKLDFVVRPSDYIKAVLWIRIRKFLGLPNPDPSIIKQKN